MSTKPALSPMRAELRETLRLAAPLAATNLLQMLVHFIDVAFITRLGSKPLAASGLGIAIFGLTLWALTALATACAPLIAAELGRRDHAVREVRRSVRMALWLAVITGLAGMVVGFSGEWLLLLFGQDPVISAMAGDFLVIISWAMIPMIAASVMRTFVAALGKPGYATWITVLAVGVNLLGNWALVFGHLGLPALGLHGSAISSVITSLAMVGAYGLVIRLDRKLRRYQVLGRWWRPDWQRMREILLIGAPIAFTVSAEAGLFSLAALLMGRIGEVELAAHIVALNVAALAFQVPFGINQAATIRVGYHFGAGDRAAIGYAGWSAIALSVGFMAITALIMLLIPTVVLRLYVDPAAPQNAVLVSLAVQYMMVAAAFQLFDGAQAVAAGALRGLQDTSMPLAIALFGYWSIGFTVSYGLGLHTSLGGLGVWIGLALGLVVVAALLTWRWHRRERLGLLPALPA
ncbi:MULTISPECIES: MATE family efflux transporter [unclassified Novosphingobium]|uniref:MATE family efflux transporter n=1 Tax=unclassified Novosphingobium TaxID=2644732 RepID=UPI0025FB99CE|nr:MULTISPECIES: MATE family efflux transporter [unclassified Novosphingobium]HQV03310.1 MATE family efflux transporter [Novosphingobium sp.]